ncbi:MAG: quinoprotein dehydrogenase-associated SoxYZ-like carrier [Acidiferrobacterales bacterium]|nr:quinoprotein dehydrogenase-associated SoxYZ-like carrier [Acidiferrobacterales bacterium]
MKLSKLSLLSLMWVIYLALSLQAHAKDDVNQVWNEQLKDFYFEDQTMLDGSDILEITAPKRAEDGAVVPVQVKSLIEQSEDTFIKNITLLIDKNPAPLAGQFEFFPESGRADLDLRIRVNSYSPVRAIAEMNDGKFYMVSRFVKASGGCSAPVGSDLDTAMQRIGKMRMKLRSEFGLEVPVQMQLAVSHPNLTGLQKDQVTTLFIPPHYIKSISVKFNDKDVLRATTDISISENPNLKFFFKPETDGTLVAEIEDSQGMKFTKSFEYKRES